MAFPPRDDFGGFAAASAGIVLGQQAAAAEGISAALPGGGGDQPEQPASTHGGPRPLALETVAATSRISRNVLECILGVLGCQPSDAIDDFVFIPVNELNVVVCTFPVDGADATSLHRGQATRFVAAVHALKAGPTTIEDIILYGSAPPQ